MRSWPRQSSSGLSDEPSTGSSSNAILGVEFRTNRDGGRNLLGEGSFGSVSASPRRLSAWPFKRQVAVPRAAPPRTKPSLDLPGPPPPQVYEGELPDGTPVAIKVLKRDDAAKSGTDALVKESDILRQCQHECLVQFLSAWGRGRARAPLPTLLAVRGTCRPLLRGQPPPRRQRASSRPPPPPGACVLRSEILLVMELVPGGSLWQALHARCEVDWERGCGRAGGPARQPPRTAAGVGVTMPPA